MKLFKYTDNRVPLGTALIDYCSIFYVRTSYHYTLLFQDGRLLCKWFNLQIVFPRNFLKARAFLISITCMCGECLKTSLIPWINNENWARRKLQSEKSNINSIITRILLFTLDVCALNFGKYICISSVIKFQ